MKQTPNFDIPTTSAYAVDVGGQPADVYAMPTRYGQTFENGKPVTDAAGMGLRLNKHVADVHFAPVGDADSGCELRDQTTPAVLARGG